MSTSLNPVESFERGSFGEILPFQFKDNSYIDKDGQKYRFLDRIQEGISKIVALFVNDRGKYFVFCFYKKWNKTSQFDIEMEIRACKIAKGDGNGHPNIALPLNLFFCESIKNMGLIYPYFTKKTLFEYVDSPYTMSERESLVVEQQMADGIRYLHELRLVHRDIKVENILWINPRKGFSSIQITDLGSVQSLDAIKHSIRSMTYEYISPELFCLPPTRGSSDDDYNQKLQTLFLRNDIWAYACSCFYIREKKMCFVYVVSLLFFKQAKLKNDTRINKPEELQKEEIEFQKIYILACEFLKSGWNKKNLLQELSMRIDVRLKKEENPVQINELSHVKEEINNLVINDLVINDPLRSFGTGHSYKKILNFDIRCDELSQLIKEFNESLAKLGVHSV